MDLSKFEALKLDETDFIVDPDAQNVCFFPLPIFTHISEMLSPSDFVHLAQTCRYMHWRMFTYGHLMLKHHSLTITTATIEDSFRIKPIVRAHGKPLIWSKIIRRPYVHIEYLHLKFDLDSYSSSMFDGVIDYVSKAKKRIKHYCIKILIPTHICTQQLFQDINNLIERLNPFYLQLHYSWNHKLSVEIPNIKNVYSVALFNLVRGETEFHMNPCAKYFVFTVQDLSDIIQEFTKNSCLQFHVCIMIPDPRQCRVMLENVWNLTFKKADHFCFSQPYNVPLYAIIPSEHGDVEIFISSDKAVIQRKETVIGQWEDFYFFLEV